MKIILKDKSGLSIVLTCFRVQKENLTDQRWTNYQSILAVIIHKWTVSWRALLKQ